jgi:hypothetical protein
MDREQTSSVAVKADGMLAVARSIPTPSGILQQVLRRAGKNARRSNPAAFLSRIWKPYCALVEQTPPEHRHFRTHEFHYTKLHPGEAELIDAQLIRDTRLAGTPRNWSSASVTRNATACRS